MDSFLFRHLGDQPAEEPVVTEGRGVPGKVTLTSRLLSGARILRKGAGEVAAGAEDAVAAAAGGSGRALPDDVRARFEASLGADLSEVRLHTGGASAAAAEAVHARAFAVGNDIHFGAGEYQPDDPFGLHLLAHEVAHTVQQRGGSATVQHKLQVSSPGDALVVEADRAADAMVAGRPAALSGGGAGTIAREKKDAAPPQPSPEHPQKGALLAGGLADKGAYKADGTGFENADLQALLTLYGTFWSVDVATPGAKPTATAPGDPAAAAPSPAPAAGKPTGDSAGKPVAEHPPWVAAFQNKIMGRAKWTDDDRATQKLVEAFLRSWTIKIDQNLPPGAEQLYHMIGGSETNGQATSIGGYNGSPNWCAAASQMGLVLGLYNRGLRFKARSHSNKYGPEMTSQMNAYVAWLGQQKKAGKVLKGSAAWTAQLEPGDIISVVNGGPSGPLSGHVATVVKHEGDTIYYVSGNAAGVQAFQGAVRVEQVKREQPPAEYDWLRDSAKSNTYVTKGQELTKERGEADAATGRYHAAWAQFVAHVPEAASLTLDQVEADAALMKKLRESGEISMVYGLRSLQREIGQHNDKAAAANKWQHDAKTDGGAPINREDPRFTANPGRYAPVAQGTSWVVEVIKASGLTKASVLASGTVDLEPNDPMIEKGPKLADQCPDAPPEALNPSPSTAGDS